MNVKNLLNDIKKLSEQEFLDLLKIMEELEPLNNLLSKLSGGEPA